MKSKFLQFSLAGLLACLLGLGLAGKAIAAADQPAGPIVSTTATALRLVPLEPQSLAKQFNATALLVDASGAPVSGTTVNFLIGDAFVAQARTNSQGQATVTITTDLDAGGYDLRAIFLGNREYDGSTADTRLVISPTTLVVQTVPAIAGIQFKVGDQSFSSGSDGFARVQLSKVGNFPLEVLPVSNQADQNMRVEFNRWFDDTYVPNRTVHIPQDTPIQIGFQVSYKVGEKFVDLQNQPVDVSRITTLTLKSNQGTTLTFSDGQPRWLPASLVTRRSTGLQIVPIQYGVISVVVDGSNVVSSEQQRFYPHPGDIWPVQLLLFSARFTARDAFLRSQVGKGIYLDYPDGTRNQFLFGRDHTVTIPSLARGIYHVQVFGVAGYAPSTPVALSQNQDMSLSILSRLDIFLAVSLGSAFALGLIVVGRTQILYSIRSKRRPSLIGEQQPPSLGRFEGQ